MTVRTLYFDESGFTGYNLLDSNQPIFAIASTDLNVASSEQLLKDSFPNYRGKEFKFSQLWRTKRNRKCFPEFGRNMGAHCDRMFIWRVDKKFAVLTKLIDYLIEPMAREAGFDFYADGFGLNYTNYIYFGLTNFGSDTLYYDLLKSYQKFSRNPTQRNLIFLETELHALAEESNEYLQVFIKSMALGARHFDRYFNIDTFHGSDELQLSSMIAIVGHWRNMYKEDFRVIHDQSSSFFRQMDHWERITNSNVPEQEHPSASGEIYQFPLRVISTESVNSENNAAIQLCDVLAGLATLYFGRDVREADREVLRLTFEAGLGSASVSGIAPEVFDPNRLEPRRREGPDSVDRMMEIMFGTHNSMLDNED